MKGTKQRILRAAKLLFNQHGVANVSQRMISDHIAISPGNLTYHFSKRETIIEALFDEIHLELNTILNEGQANVDQHSFASLYHLFKAINKVLFENRFFVLDFAHITRINPSIHKKYAEIMDKREELLTSIIHEFHQKKWIRDEKLTDEYLFLAHQIQTTNDYWLLSTNNRNEDFMLKQTRINAEGLLYSIYPYLSKKGEVIFEEEFGHLIIV